MGYSNSIDHFSNNIFGDDTMINTQYLKFLKGGILAYFIISLITGVLSGATIAVTDGDFKPLAENTLGLLLASDNQAYQLEKDWESGTFDTDNDSFDQLIKDAVLRTILTNIVITFLVLFSLFKIIEKWLEWNQPLGTKFTLLAIIIALIIYAVLGIIYYLISSIGGGLEGKFLDTLVAGIPLKSLFYGIKVLATTL